MIESKDQKKETNKVQIQQSGVMSWADVDALLAKIRRVQPSNAAGLLAMLETFVAANEDPGRSPNFRDQVG